MADAEEDEDSIKMTPMDLTDEELEWSLALRQAVKEDDELLERPDFDYVVMTLLCLDDLEDAKERLKKMQNFREEYGIHDNLQEGVELILQFIVHQQPWFVLDVHVDVETDTAVFAQDFSVLDPSKVKSDADWRIFLGGFYYLYQILQPTFGLIREGILVIAEIDGVGWKNFDVNFMQRHFHHLLEYYPLVIKESRMVHSSVVGNMLMAMLKRLRMDVQHSPIEVGCQIEELSGRLEEMFKTPTPEVAQARLLVKCTENLQLRYQNYESFQLPASVEDIYKGRRQHYGLQFAVAMNETDQSRIQR